MNLSLDNWFDLVQSVAIVVSILLTLLALREQAHQLKVGNLFLMTQHHRELWGYMLDHPDLQRIFDMNVDLQTQPITERERTFMRMLFLHCEACVKAIKAGVATPVHGAEADIRSILSYPLPREVWKEARRFHEPEFVKFVQNADRLSV